MKSKITGMALAIVTTLLLLGCPNPVTDPPNSTNADLSALTVSEGTLSPAFAAGTTAYSVSVPNATTSITVTGTKADANAIVSPNSGVSQSLNVGSNTITITVTAQDGTTIKNYVVTVLRWGTDLTSANIGTLKYVPAGRFQRDGSASNISEITQPYRMSATEITRAQFLAIMGTDPSNTTYSSSTSDPVQMTNWYHAIAFCNKLSLAEGLTPVYAVSGVNFGTLTYASIPTTSNADWDAATATWTNNGYRLPTEMEWMWAAMGAPASGQGGLTNTTGYLKAFAGSTGSNAIGDYAVFGYYGSETGKTTTERSNPVASKLANELGLYDMSGNVWEWCWDMYADYPTGTQTDYRGAASGAGRVVRGGSWDFGASGCTVAFRGYGDPYYQAIGFGFRVVRP